MKITVILNCKAGASEQNGLPDKIRRAFREKDAQVEIWSVSGNELIDHARQAVDSDADVVAVAGGDGTLSSVAGVLSGTRKPLGIIPAGTLNHFAKDLGIPLDMDEAVQLILTGKPQPVDTAEVNGKIFINNSSVGLYARAVRLREKYLRRIGGGKWAAMFLASLSVFTRFPLFSARLETGQGSVEIKAPFIFIGNNEYKLDLFNFGSRTTFAGGELSLYIANCQDRWSVLRFAVQALLGRIDRERDFRLQFVKEIWLETPKPLVRVALDGEIHYMKPPLHYKIRPRDLWVIRP